MFIQALLNGIFQVVLFTIIPLIWWFVTARKKENFFRWLGVKGIGVKDKKRWIITVIAIGAICWGLGEFAVFLRGPMEAADSQYKGMGAAAIPSILAYAFIQTAMSEEILFRGFLLKRLVSAFGFVKANMIQAAIFGAIHLLMVWGQVGYFAGFIIVVYPMVAAIAFAYMNEKLSNGSILPSWIVHGLLNAIQGIMSAV